MDAAFSFSDGGLGRALGGLASPALDQHLANTLAQTWIEAAHDYIDAGKSFRPDTGILEQSMGWLPTGGGTADVYAKAGYAGYVEKGTPPHTIRPRRGRKGLKIPNGGGYSIEAEVNHPGSKAYPYFFTDLDHRTMLMEQAGLAVLAEAAARG